MNRPDNNNSKLPAVVVGDGLNALGIVRSLGAANIPVIVVGTDPKSPAMRSRYGRKLLCGAVEGAPFVERMIELGKQYGKQLMLFVTEEKTVDEVSASRARLAPYFYLRMPDHERLMALMHKQGFQDLAEAVNAPVPRTVRLESKAELPRIDALKFPCVFKPAKKDYGYGARFKKAYKVASPAEVATLYDEIYPVLADMVVQEWIEGTDNEVYFCLQYVGDGGEVVSSFTGRKIRAWPPRIGGTASCTAAWEVADELDAMTTTFFKQVGFTGMGSMEYKRDERDGRFYMVEPTVARTDFQEEVASLNGVNIPAAAYRYELGLPQVAPEKVAVPRIWREPVTDRWSFQEGGSIDERSRGHAVVDAYWRLNDPRPWLDLIVGRIGAKLGRAA
jgi:predicted ATP-grasp superfamily ATP-dependent carboligase